jgi:hypothetical protein
VNRRLVVVLLSILVVLAALVTVVDLMRWRARREAVKTVAAGLLDLETFRIEYLDNRLTIKPRKGKSFDLSRRHAIA